MLETVGLIAGSGWASGLNLYLSVFLLGTAGRLDWVGVPAVITRTDVMVVAGTMYLVEFAADKIAFFDSFWDVLHTIVRPVGAAVLGYILANQSAEISEALGSLGSGGLALASHLAKATTRATANTSPEPISNVLLSLFEDVVAAAVVILAITYPRVAILVVTILTVAAVAITVHSFKVLKRVWGMVKERFGGLP